MDLLLKNHHTTHVISNYSIHPLDNSNTRLGDLRVNKKNLITEPSLELHELTINSLKHTSSVSQNSNTWSSWQIRPITASALPQTKHNHN